MWGKLPVIAVLSYSKGLSYAERTEGLGDVQGTLSTNISTAIELWNFEFSGDETKNCQFFVCLPSLIILIILLISVLLIKSILNAYRPHVFDYIISNTNVQTIYLNKRRSKCYSNLQTQTSELSQLHYMSEIK